MKEFSDNLVEKKMQYQGVWEISEEFSDLLNNMGGRCLDIGCGDGYLTREIILPKLSDDSLLVGVDASNEMIECAKEKWMNERRMSFLKLNIETPRKMGNEIGKYNNVVSFYYLHFNKNIQQTTRNISRLLEIGGQGLLMFITHHDIFDVYISFRNDPKYGNYMQDVFFHLAPHYGCPNATELMKKDLEFAGLRVIHCSNREMSVTYRNYQDLQNSLMEMDPFLHRMPEDLREEYKGDVTRQYLQNKISLGDKNIKLNGCIVDKYRAIVVHFEKS